MIAGITGRIHAGLTVESIDRQTGIIRDHSTPECSGCSGRLQTCVFHESCAGLIDIFVKARFSLTDDLHTEIRQEIAHFGDLTLIIGCDY